MMKRKRCLVSLGVGAILISGCDSHWKSIGQTDESEFYISTEPPVSTAPGVYQVWFKFKYSQPQQVPLSGTQYREKLERYSINCQTRETKIVAVRFEDGTSNGLVIQDENQPWTITMPETVGGIQVKKVCDSRR